MAAYDTPDKENAQLGTAVVSFQKDSTGDFRHLGNALAASQQNEITKKERFIFFGGKKRRNRTDIDTVKSSGKLRIDEIVPQNVALWALGTVIENTDGTFTIKNLSAESVTGVLKIQQDNDRGPKILWQATVTFTPSGDFNFISEDYNVIELDFDIEEDQVGDFGSFTFPATI